ncbi:MAG: DNA primase [Clostridiales bacterium]|nr:DNA primase [Clostridiales bacterium]
MHLYSNELIDEVRNRNDIVSVIGSYIKLQKKGSNYMGLCPFHNEKTPSFAVNAAKQFYHCFGCGAGGNVFTFIMEYENYSFPEALKLLADRAGIKLPEEEADGEAKRKADERGRLLEINKQAAIYYYRQLKGDQGREAYRYLTERGLTDETIKHFGLGYSTKDSSDLYRYLKKLGHTDELLAQTGLFRFDERLGGRDKFRDRVIFPIMDINHRVIGFGGRIMGSAGPDVPKYLNSPETKLFEKSRNLYGLNYAKSSRKNQILLCEGYMDVIALHQAGFTNAVAALGTALGASHAALLKRYTAEVVLTFDSDEAGVNAALRAIPILKEAGLIVKVLDMKPYKDPDEFIKAAGAEEFQKRIDSAKNSFFFEIEILQKDFDMSDPEQKMRFFNEMGKKLLTFTDELERNFYIDSMAKAYSIDPQQLIRLVNRLGAQLSAPGGRDMGRPDGGKGKRPVEDGIIKAQKLILTWLTDDPALYEKVKDFLTPEDFVEGIFRDVAEMVYEQYERDRSVDPAKIISQFSDKEEQATVAAIFSAQVQGELDETRRKKAIRDTIMKLKEDSLDRLSQKAIEANDTAYLMEIIAKKAELKKRTIGL